MNSIKGTPTLTDTLKAFKENIFESFNCHAVAEVVRVDRDADNVDLKMVYKKTKIEVQENGIAQKRNIEYPIMVDCPIVSMTGGNAGVFLPIQIGDKALVLFNDRDIDNFLVDGNQESPASNRKHSFTDAIALVGIRNLSQTFGQDATLFNGSSVVSVGEKIEISNSSQNLLSIMNEFLDAISNLTVTCTGPGNISSTPTNAAQFSAVKSKIGSLLK